MNSEYYWIFFLLYYIIYPPASYRRSIVEYTRRNEDRNDEYTHRNILFCNSWTKSLRGLRPRKLKLETNTLRWFDLRYRILHVLL